MCRAAILALMLAFTSSLVAAQDTKDKKEEKKEEKKDKKEPKGKDPLQETLRIGDYDLTVGDWIKKLRTHESVTHRRLALIALEASNTADKSGLPALLDTIEKDKDTQVRQEAVSLLGRLPTGTRGAMKALVESLQTDKSGDVREAAALAIGGPFLKQVPDYINVVAAAIKDEHVGTRIAVAATLRDLGAQRDVGHRVKPALPLLFEALKNPKENVQVRAAAIHVLSRQGREEDATIPLLVDLLKDSNTPPSLREAAADGLGRSDSDKAEVIAALTGVLADKKLELRKAAAVALGVLGVKAKSGWPVIKERVAFMADAPAESDSAVRNHLIRLTGALAKTSTEAEKALVELAIKDTSTENRIAAIQELGEVPSMAKESRAVLDTIRREDARQAVREAAAKALKLK